MNLTKFLTHNSHTLFGFGRTGFFFRPKFLKPVLCDDVAVVAYDARLYCYWYQLCVVDVADAVCKVCVGNPTVRGQNHAIARDIIRWWLFKFEFAKKLRCSKQNGVVFQSTKGGLEQVFVNEIKDLVYFVPMFQSWDTRYEVLRDLVIKRFDFAVQN